MNMTSQAERRADRTRRKLKQKAEKRLVVFRSNKYFYAQIIDKSGKVLLAVNQKELGKVKKNKTESAGLLGELLASKAKNKKLGGLVFDRGPYRYNGRVKAFAESVRKAGLKF